MVRLGYAAALMGVQIINARSEERSVFVAYPYALPQDDYRRPFKAVEKAFNVKFEFADDEITNKHLLDKVTRMIGKARFGLFDITRWNPNVTLELGIAIGLQRSYYLLFNPTDAGTHPPADLGGIDRIEYTSYGGLESSLTKLLIQEFGVPSESGDPLAKLREQVLAVVETKNGPKVNTIAAELGVPVEFAKTLVRSMVAEGQLRTTGQTRATRYYYGNG
jgi:hypothetical protein